MDEALLSGVAGATFAGDPNRFGKSGQAWLQSECGVSTPNEYDIICGGKGMLRMKYPFLTLDDGTEITHSDKFPDGSVKVYVEKADEKDCFHHATCILPSYDWKDVFGFNDAEMTRYKEVVMSTAHLMMEFAETGGFQRASGF